MNDKPPSKPGNLPIDEYHPLESPIKEAPKKKRGSLILILLTLFLIVVLVGLIILVFKPTLIKDISNIQISQKIKNLSDSTEQEETILPQAKENSLPSNLSNEERIVEVESELVELRKRNQELTSQTEEQEKEISRLNYKIRQVNEDKNKAENQVKKLQGQVEQNKLYYEKQIKQLKDDWEQKKQELESKLTETTDELDTTSKRLQAQSEIYRRRSNKETAAVEEILREASKTQQRLKQTEEAKRKAEDEVRELKKRLAEMEAKVNAVKEGDLVALTSDVQKPQVLKSDNPRYPIWARRRGVKGEVTLRVLVSETGQVLDAEVLKCSQPGYGLEDSALKAVKKWEFSPAKKEGKKVKVWMNITITFKT